MEVCLLLDQLTKQVSVAMIKNCASYFLARAIRCARLGSYFIFYYAVLRTFFIHAYINPFLHHIRISYGNVMSLLAAHEWKMRKQLNKTLTTKREEIHIK